MSSPFLIESVCIQPWVPINARIFHFKLKVPLIKSVCIQPWVTNKRTNFS